jgi:4-hydroxy-tetrahydrodipicolinate synthase
MRLLAGVVPILLMPTDEADEFDEQGLRRQVGHVLDAGVAAFGFGYASEPFRFTDREREHALRVVVEQTAGRALVLAHLPASSTVAGATAAARLAELGADLLMVPAPPSSDESQLPGYYAAIAAAGGIPIIVQDAPAAGVAEMSVDCLLRLAQEVELIVAIKVETAPTPEKVARLLAVLDPSTTVLGGMGGLEFLNELERGVHGTMPGTALVDFFVRVWALHRDGERAAARALFTRILPILTLSLRSADSFLQVEKELLRRRGIFQCASLRRPVAPMDRGVAAELDMYCADLDFELTGVARTASVS